MKILLGTKNRGKIAEFQALFNRLDVELIGLDTLKLIDEPIESGDSYFENALIKAKYYYEHFKIPCLCDDSGLEVEALNGAPGVKSARLSQLNDDSSRRQELLRLLKDQPNRNGRFVSQLVFYDGHTIIEAAGFLRGIIINNEKGNNGFGYDPLFLIEGRNQTMAELSQNEKNTISHRYQAFISLLPKLESWLKSKNHLKLLETRIIETSKIIYQTDNVQINYRLSGGMSNYTYVVSVNNNKKVFRLPGENAEKFVNRSVEKKNLQIIEPLMNNPRTEYFNIETGIKIAPYTEGISLHTTEDYKIDDVAKLLKQLHQSKVQAINDYQPFERIKQYEAYCQDIGYHHDENYHFVKEKLWRFKPYLESLPKVLCHGDAQRSNFVKKTDGNLMLVDYEFCGNNDHFYDIACFGNRELSKGFDLLYHYLERKPTLAEERRLLLWHAFQSLQWFNVAIYKHLTGLGETLGFDFYQVAMRYLKSCHNNCDLAIKITDELADNIF